MLDLMIVLPCILSLFTISCKNLVKKDQSKVVIQVDQAPSKYRSKKKKRGRLEIPSTLVRIPINTVELNSAVLKDKIEAAKGASKVLLPNDDSDLSE
uniref:Uncharacterized protein n=1 Tax=Rhabditophanes sp. KR3021 TaxID=114890 RepID=A0AC35U205_9BILA